MVKPTIVPLCGAAANQPWRHPHAGWYIPRSGPPRAFLAHDTNSDGAGKTNRGVRSSIGVN